MAGCDGVTVLSHKDEPRKFDSFARYIVFINGRLVLTGTHRFCTAKLTVRFCCCPQIYANSNSKKFHVKDVTQVRFLQAAHNSLMLLSSSGRTRKKDDVMICNPRVTNCNNWKEHLESLPKIVRK